MADLSVRRSAATTAVAVILVVVSTIAGLFAWSTETLAAGDGERGRWRITASWNPWQTCIRRHEPRAEGGACGLAWPADINESTLFLVNDAGDSVTYVAGPVPDGATAVRLTTVDGEVTRARFASAGPDRFFVADFAGARQLADITALDVQGRVLASLEHGPMPPAAYPDGSPP